MIKSKNDTKPQQTLIYINLSWNQLQSHNKPKNQINRMLLPDLPIDLSEGSNKILGKTIFPHYDLLVFTIYILILNMRYNTRLNIKEEWGETLYNLLQHPPQGNSPKYIKQIYNKSCLCHSQVQFPSSTNVMGISSLLWLLHSTGYNLFIGLLRIDVFPFIT